MVLSFFTQKSTRSAKLSSVFAERFSGEGQADFAINKAHKVSLKGRNNLYISCVFNGFKYMCKTVVVVYSFYAFFLQRLLSYMQSFMLFESFKLYFIISDCCGMINVIYHMKNTFFKFCICEKKDADPKCEKKDADRLCSNCTADQRLCFRYNSSSSKVRNFKHLASFCDYRPVCVGPGRTAEICFFLFFSGMIKVIYHFLSTDK